MEKKDYIWKELYDYNDFDTRWDPLRWKIVAVDFKDRFIVEFDDLEDDVFVYNSIEQMNQQDIYLEERRVEWIDKIMREIKTIIMGTMYEADYEKIKQVILSNMPV